ncbi:STAS domain-containing protein, partial [Streptomyces goshikiensis]|uniref:STAS domain-containing protein n=1 Tax=Streptomyces goshikiensis TaxID=1942 RepID=UPI0036C20A46
MTRLPDSGDGALVLVLTGEFDNGTVVPFGRALSEARAAPAVRTIIDVSRVAYADSGLLRLLLEGHRRLPRFTVAGPLPPQLRRLLTFTDAVGTLRIAPDVDAGGGGRGG